MKFFMISLVVFIFFGCSRDNAFDRFHMTHTQKLAQNSIQTSKLKFKDEVNGVVSVVYLNEVLKDRYKDNEYFYVYLYTKGENQKLTFLLNKKPAIKIIKLDSVNEFSQFIKFDSSWNEYYLVEFPKQGDMLRFKLKNKQFNSDILIFEKDK